MIKMNGGQKCNKGREKGIENCCCCCCSVGGYLEVCECVEGVGRWVGRYVHMDLVDDGEKGWVGWVVAKEKEGGEVPRQEW